MKNILVTASWCGPCFALKNRLNQAELKNYEILEIDTGDDKEEKTAKVKTWGVKSVPRLVVLNEKEQVVDVIDGSDDIFNKIQGEVKSKKGKTKNV